MELSGTRQIAADPDSVWAALLDPSVLQSCVPGCTEMAGTPADGFEATVVQKVGPVKATFRGRVTLEDRDPPHALTIAGEGKGGAVGFAKGGARVRLEPQDGGTLMTYSVDARVGGKLAQLGSRIIDGFAKKMADDFFTRFKDKVEGPGRGDEGTEEPAPQKRGSFGTAG